MKRSQAINIALTKLPPVRTVKQAIVNMDSSVIDREGIDVSLKSYHHPPPYPSTYLFGVIVQVKIVFRKTVVVTEVSTT